MYCLPNIIRVIKSRRLRWAVHAVRMEDGRSVFRMFTGKIKIYKTIIFTFVLYGCETRCLTLRDKRRLRVFDDRILRRILDPRGMRMES